MATTETVNLGVPHEPKEDSVKAFNEIEVELKKTLQHLRHDMNSKGVDSGGLSTTNSW
jgi:hypothetical protein